MTNKVDKETARHKKAMSVAEQLHLIADGIADDVYRNFSFTARETQRTQWDEKLRKQHGQAPDNEMTIVFALGASATLFYDDMKKRKEDLEQLMREIASDEDGALVEQPWLNGPPIESCITYADVTGKDDKDG